MDTFFQVHSFCVLTQGSVYGIEGADAKKMNVSKSFELVLSMFNLIITETELDKYYPNNQIIR